MALRKALKNYFLLCLLILACVRGFTQEGQGDFDIEEVRRRIYGEAPLELLSFSLLDSEVSLFMTGSWKGALQFGTGFLVSPLGFGFSSSHVPLFEQEADIGLSLWINDRWFVEANFAENSIGNTYRAGYEGRQREFIQYIGIGNTGLDFPSFPYLDLGGDSTSSFGFYSRFGSGDLSFHALVRYDSASREERVFYGSRERTYNYVQPQNPIRGVSFVLPDTNIDSNIIIYIEDENGTVYDSSGRRWRIASSSEYAVSRLNGLLELSIRPQGMIAVSYTVQGVLSPWNSMGDYDDQTGFLSDIQKWFTGVNLKDYPQCGERSGSAFPGRPGEVMFGQLNALVIYESGTFSPFERQSRYNSPSGAAEEAAVVKVSSGELITSFELVRIDSFTAYSDIPLLDQTINTRGVYDLLRAGSQERRSPESIWPLADIYPEIYLVSPGVFTGDITLRFTNYNSAGGYLIGTDAVSGSIQVWRSGIQDVNFSYNSSTGEVTLLSAAGNNELIRITYLKRSEETNAGSIAAGFGAVYGGRGPFSAQAAIGVRWNLSEDAFSVDDQRNTGTVGVSMKAALDYDSLKAHVTGGFMFVQTDTTNLYRAAGMEGSEIVIALTPETSFISNPPIISSYLLNLSNRADLIYRNYYDNSIMGSTLMNIEWNTPVISGINRPYPAKDLYLGDTQVLTAEFELNQETNWTGFQVPLDYYMDIISRAGEIEIPYRLYDIQGDIAGLKLIIQIGSLSGSDFSFMENSNLIWEKTIYPRAGAAPEGDADLASFFLNDNDRIKLADAKYLRVIALYEGSGDISGRVLIASPIVHGAAFRAVTYDSSANTINAESNLGAVYNNVNVLETRDASLGINHPETNRLSSTHNVLEIRWEDMQAGIGAGADGRISNVPLADYRSLSFYVKPSNNFDGTLHFYAASGSESLKNAYLEAHIPVSALSPDKWSKVTICYQGDNQGVFVDGEAVLYASFHYRPQGLNPDPSSQVLSYIALIIDRAGAALENGSIRIDEIILEDAVHVYRMNLGAAFQYSRRGSIISAGGIPVLSDFAISTAAESEYRVHGGQPDNITGSVVSRTGAQISVFGVQLKGNFSFTSAQESFVWNADHSLSRAIGYFSFRESFYASPYANYTRHSFNMAFSSDFFAGFDADAVYDLYKLKQNWNYNIGYRSRNVLIPAVSVNARSEWTSAERVSEDENYLDLYVRSWKPLVPDLGYNAETRRTSSQIVLNMRTVPVGAVITADGKTGFIAANNITQSENSLFLNVPVVLGDLNFNIRAGRSFKMHLNFSGDDALADGTKFFESLHDSIHLWRIVPGYSLFASELNDAMDALINDSPLSPLANYIAFNDHFSTGVNFPSVYNLWSFIIPSGASLRLERMLEQKMDTRADMLNIGAGIGFSSINMFGALGYITLFPFYQNDEFIHAVETGFIIPNDEDIIWRLQSSFRAAFMGFTGGRLNLRNQITWRSDGHWVETFSFDWETPARFTLINFVYNWLISLVSDDSSWFTMSTLFRSRYEQLRREILELSFDNSGKNLRWLITAGHEEIIRIPGRLNFTGFLKFILGQDYNSETFTFDAVIGTSLRISF
ncbi:MAG: hypothetical protein FWB83_00660 [Treponema sp.]|nr:hypothetical protein [Treponema sp.]